MDENVGIVKEIDNLGRIVIPKDLRKRFGLEESVELVVTQNGILIRSLKYKLVKRAEESSGTNND